MCQSIAGAARLTFHPKITYSCFASVFRITSFEVQSPIRLPCAPCMCEPIEWTFVILTRMPWRQPLPDASKSPESRCSFCADPRTETSAGWWIASETEKGSAISSAGGLSGKPCYETHPMVCCTRIIEAPELTSSLRLRTGISDSLALLTALLRCRFQVQAFPLPSDPACPDSEYRRYGDIQGIFGRHPDFFNELGRA